MRLDDQIEALATRQHSLVAVFQLYGLGATRTEVSRLVSGERFVRVTDRVLAVRGGPGTVRRSLMCAVLDASPGAVLSHPTAAHVWGAPGCERSRSMYSVTVASPVGARPPPGCTR